MLLNARIISRKEPGSDLILLVIYDTTAYKEVGGGGL
jgi:hypothetical protein